MSKKSTWNKIMAQLKEAYKEEFHTDIEEELEEEFDINEIPEDEDPNSDSFITRMTLAYNNLVEACETMPTSYSKEFTYKKDKDRARILYNRCVDIAEQYHNFLIRMREKVT